MSFANQVAVITGASSGIGWALAKLLAAQQCKVGLIARRKEKLDALAEEICQNLGLALGQMKLKRFSDGEINLQILENVRGADARGASACPKQSPGSGFQLLRTIASTCSPARGKD